MIKDCIISNSDVRIEHNDESYKYDAKGQALEVAMIQFLFDNDYDVPQEMIYRNVEAKKLA